MHRILKCESGSVKAALLQLAPLPQTTQPNSMIYFDNNLELFLDPDADNHHYAELEFNGLGQVWDLLMSKPYRCLSGWMFTCVANSWA